MRRPMRRPSSSRNSQSETACSSPPSSGATSAGKYPAWSRRSASYTATALGSCSFSGSRTSASRRPGANASSGSASARYDEPASFTTRRRGSSQRRASPVAASRSQKPDSPRSSQTRSRDSELEEPARGMDDPFDRRHVVILDLPVRIRDVEAGHAQHGTMQVEDRLLRQDGRDL